MKRAPRLETDAIVLDAPLRVAQSLRIPYGELTHLARTRRGLLIASRRTIAVVRDRPGEAAEAMDVDPLQGLEDAIRGRLASTADGALQLSRMRALDALERNRVPSWVVVGLVGLCLVGFAVQMAMPMAQYALTFRPDLFAQGELWRAVTSHFVHAPFLALHLAFILLGLLIFGPWGERILGSGRTAARVLLAGAAAMVGCYLRSYLGVLGASGLVMGLVGALVALEWHRPESLPAQWRVPRAAWLAAVALQATLDVALPVIASMAHLGGFVAGYLGALWLTRDAAQRAPLAPPVAALVGAGAVSIVLSVAAVLPLIRLEASALEMHAHRLFRSDVTSVDHDNTVAWLLVTEARPGAAGLGLAVALAERAVESTDRDDPDILDTLAESLYAIGDQRRALHIIDEAIALSEGERYFTEQRRRFTGERDWHDRPEPPTLPWRLRERVPEPARESPGPAWPDEDEGVEI